ncbi:MAG: cyanophycin synthetase, partial [Kiritimatiellae bacterium]|nr:cyanophycin synthetase [Kiritimatiellia bacterium]
AGVELVQQDGAAIHCDTEAVVYSTAIEADNPDMAAAKEKSVPLKHRAAVLAELAPGHGVLAVAGTAGKTTTTGMVGWALEQLGADPTVINGGALVQWADAAHVGNVRRGAPGAPWVIEVDESDRSLLQFHPDWSILTNISQDHFSLAEVQDVFRAYAAQVQTGIVCGAGVKEVLGPQSVRVVEAAVVPQRTDAGFDVPWRGQRLAVPQPGAHNALDALLAAELCAQLGYAPSDIVAALGRFGGIQRRLERVDQNGPVRVVDDYGHNPAKLTAAWEAVRAPGHRVLGVWRPHGYGPLRLMLAPLADALATVWRPGDKLWVLPVYDAGGTADRSIQSDALVAAVRARGVDVELADSYDALGTAMLQAVCSGDTLLIMGARDPHLPVFAREMATRTASLPSLPGTDSTSPGAGVRVGFGP